MILNIRIVEIKRLVGLLFTHLIDLESLKIEAKKASTLFSMDFTLTQDLYVNNIIDIKPAKG